MQPNFTCPFTEEPCDDGRCHRNKCVIASEEEAWLRQLDNEKRLQAKKLHQRDELVKREAALRVLIDRVLELNSSQNEKRYKLPNPKGMRRGPKREAEEEALNKLLNMILTLPKFSDRLAAAIGAIRAMRRFSN
jgi:hypothetical protein